MSESITPKQIREKALQSMEPKDRTEITGLYANDHLDSLVREYQQLRQVQQVARVPAETQVIDGFSTASGNRTLVRKFLKKAETCMPAAAEPTTK